MKSLKTQFVTALLAVLAVGAFTVGCNKSATDKAVDNTKSAASDAGNDIKNAADKTGDAIKNGAVATKDAVTNAAESATSTNN
ncbi:MAG TPA: hypothetical protein VIK59_00020 [Verrucomicrobiae bacterium]